MTKLIEVLPHISNSTFIRTMLHAMLLLAFYAFLRIGEMTKTGSAKQHFIVAKHVKFIRNDHLEKCIELTIPHCKHSNKSATILIRDNPSELLCPYVACRKFSSLRLLQSFLFIHGRHTNVTNIFHWTLAAGLFGLWVS